MKLEEAIVLAVRNLTKEGITDVDIFSQQFEIDMLKDSDFRDSLIKEVEKRLKCKDVKSMGFSPISHVLVPKKEFYDFRKCALIEPIDEVKYLALCLQLAGPIEAARPHKDKGQVFSYRFSPGDGYIFDLKSNYTTFRKFFRKKCCDEDVKVVVACDIANFYDRLNLHRLECILKSLPGINNGVVDRLNELLSFWSGRDSYGIPVGSNASRILAEAALIEVDNFLNENSISYCRYVDDFRIFAKNSAEAHHALSLLVQKLAKEGLFLNTKKTELISTSEMTFSQPGKESEDREAGSSEKLGLYKIIRGYSGMVPTKFRALSSRELKKLSEINPVFDETKDLSNVDAGFMHEHIVRLTRICVAQKCAGGMVNLVSQLHYYSQFLPYITDAIKKNADFFSDEQKLEIIHSLKGWLERDNTPEYISIYVARFFSQRSFLDKKILLDTFLRLKRNDGSYIGRVLLEVLESHLSRGEILKIKDYFLRSDSYEKRQIAKIIKGGLTKEEARPFLKNASMLQNDLFVDKMYGDLK